MERRAVLKDLILIAGGITLLPACLDQPGKASIALKNLDISADQEKLLADVADTIIPNTNTPGAKELGAHLFVLKMLDDCYEQTDQEQFIRGLNDLDKSTKQRFGRSFVKCTASERTQMLLSVEGKETFNAEVYDFYKIMKEKTLQGYLTSRYVVRDIMKYELIPTVPYNGYHLIKNTKDHGRQS